MTATTSRRHRRPHRRGHRLARGQLGPRPHGGGVVGPPRPFGLGRAHVAGRVVRQGPRRAPRASGSCRPSATFGALGAPGGLGTLLAGPDDHRPRHRGAEAALPRSTSSPASRPGASCSASPAPAPTSPGSTRAPSSTATSGSSTGRRCGPRAGTGPISACCSPAPIPTSPSTRASPTSRSTCTSRASRSARCASSPGARCSTRCSSPTCASRRRRHRRRQQRLGGRQHHARCSSAAGSAPAGAAAAWPRCPAPSAATSPGAPATSSAPRSSPAAVAAGRSMSVQNLTELARANGTIDDPEVRQSLAQLYTLNEIARVHEPRASVRCAKAGGEIPGLGNIAKLSMSRILRLTRDLSGRILGPTPPCTATRPTTSEALVAATDGAVQPGVPSRCCSRRPADLRRHRRDPAQHPRRAGPGPAQGAQRQQGQGVPGDPQERLGVVARDGRSRIACSRRTPAVPIRTGGTVRHARRG